MSAAPLYRRTWFFWLAVAGMLLLISAFGIGFGKHAFLAYSISRAERLAASGELVGLGLAEADEKLWLAEVQFDSASGQPYWTWSQGFNLTFVFVTVDDQGRITGATVERD